MIIKLKRLFFILIFAAAFIGCERSTNVAPEDDGLPPTIPTGLRVYYQADGEVVIDWRRNSESDVKGYNIYRRINNLDTLLIDFTNEDFYLDDSLSYSDTFYYKITAVDIKNNESPPTLEVSAMPVNKFRPFTPFNLTINARNWENEISIYLNWYPSEETDIAGFNIFRSENAVFNPDSSTLIAFSDKPEYNDTASLEFYKNYFYKINAVDKGGLVSNATPEVNDLILEVPAILYPPDNSIINRGEDFIIRTIAVQTTYRLVIQKNIFFGEVFSKDFSSPLTNDSLTIEINYNQLGTNTDYYWRIITYTGTEPNSISPLYKFKVKN